jgi:hypothetical protein
MPQQAPTIKDLDGLPAGEIHLAIAQSETRQVDRLEQKLAEHRELIERRLDTQDARLEVMQEDLSALVGSEKVPGQVTRLNDLVQGLVDKHDRWHEQDEVFRSAITLQVAQLSEQHMVVAKDVRQVRWFITACYAIGKAGRLTVAIVREGKDIYKAVAACGITWLVVVQFLHVILPYLKHYLPR